MIPFRQYKLPSGRYTEIYINRPENITAKAEQIINDGNRFEVEILTNGLVSLTIFNIDKEEDVGIEICNNGPEVEFAVDKLIMEYQK